MCATLTIINCQEKNIKKLKKLTALGFKKSESLSLTLAILKVLLL